MYWCPLPKGQTATDLLRLYATYKEPLGQSVIEEATSGESGKLRQLTPFVMEIQAALQAVEALEARIRAWALAPSTYTSFIQEYVSRPGFMLAYLREDGSGLPRTSTLDALCYLYGLKLDILVLDPQSNLLEIQHQYVPSSYDETVRLYHRATEDSLSLNHFYC